MRKRKDKSSTPRERSCGRNCCLATAWIAALYVVWVLAHWALGYHRLAWFYQGVGFLVLFVALVFTLLVLLLTGLQIGMLWLVVRCRRCVSGGFRRWGPKAKDDSELASELSGVGGPGWRDEGPSSFLSPELASPPELV